MAKHHLICPNGCVEKIMVYPVDDPATCPRLAEHSECHECGAVMFEIDPQTMMPFDPQPLRPHERT